MSLLFSDSLTPISTALAAIILGIVVSRLLSPFVTEQNKRRENKILKAKELMSQKLNAGITITPQDITYIGRGVGCSSSDTGTALYSLYAESTNKDQHIPLQKLLEDLNREEPFESLPEEVRPSMARVAALIESSSEKADREIMHPLRKILEEYQAMKQDHISIKRQNYISYIVAIISFIIGAWGLVMTFTGPSKEFITKEIRSALIETQKGPAIGNQDRSIIK